MPETMLRHSLCNAAYIAAKMFIWMKIFAKHMILITEIMRSHHFMPIINIINSEIKALTYAPPGGTRGTFLPLPKFKTLIYKNDVLSEGSIFSHNLSKIDKNSIFLLIFSQKISTFSQCFQTICISRPNAPKIKVF